MQQKDVSRTAYAVKNSFFGIIGKLLTLFISFTSRTIFIYELGKYYLGVNGLYTDVLNMLSFAELGFGSAMVFALYKPVAEGEDEKTRQLMLFYKNIYRLIALIVLTLGLVLVPFLQYIISGAGSLSLFELRLYFLIFLINTVTTYFVSYKYSLANALQKNYLTTNIDTITNVICSIVQIIVLLLTSNFLAYLLANTLTLILSRFIIALYLNHEFPILKKRPQRPLDRESKRVILHEVKGLAIQKFSSIAIYSTDSIIISAVPALGIAMVGSVSNYNMIINSVSGIIVILFNAIISGFGNLAVTSSKQHFKEVFFESNLIDFWIYGVCTVCLFVLLSPFIQLWVGSDYLIDRMSLLLILVNFYLQGQSVIYNNARVAKGNFNLEKWCSLAQALINLVISVIGALWLGLVGVYIGTIISRVFYMIARPLATYRYLFGSSPVEYFKQSVQYFIAVIVAVIICHVACQPMLTHITIFTLCVSAIICLFLSNALFVLFFGRRVETKTFIHRIINLIKRK